MNIGITIFIVVLALITFGILAGVLGVFTIPIIALCFAITYFYLKGKEKGRNKVNEIHR